MSYWVNRTALSGSSTAANGTNSHTCTFTAATAGNLLVAVVGGAVTFTTPSGWTLQASTVNNCGLYLFTKTASSGESSFSTTHNGTDFIIKGVVYEYAASSNYLDSNTATGQSNNSTVTGPAVTGLTGTYTSFAVRVWDMANGITIASTVWTLPSVEDVDDTTLRGTHDGVSLTIAYDDNQSASSFNPSSVMTTNGGASGESIAFAISTPAPSLNASISWFKAT